MKTAAIFDTETTGFPKSKYKPIEEQPRIIEIGISLIDIKTYEVIEEIDQLINPTVPIPAAASKVNGIFDADVASSRIFADIFPEIQDIFKKADVAVAHNFPFDFKLLSIEVERLKKEIVMPKKCFCSVQEYVHVFGFRPSLKVLWEHLFAPEKLAQSHRAIDDVHRLTECLKKDNFFGKIKSAK